MYLFQWVELFLVSIIVSVYSKLGERNLCTHPVGKCEFYTDCIKDVSNSTCPSARDIMYKKCVEYSALDQSFSPLGIKWGNGVKICLQHKMAQVLFDSKRTAFTCDDADNIFFNHHVDCYLYGSDVSFCDIPMKDQLLVVMHATSLIVDGHMFDLVHEGMEVIHACLFKSRKYNNNYKAYDFNENEEKPL